MEKLYIESDGAGQFKRGNISFGITFQLGMRVLPDLLIKFNQQFPKMNCYVYDKRHVELEKSLLSGERIWQLLISRKRRKNQRYLMTAF